MKTLTGSMLAFLLSLTLLTACGGGTNTDNSTPPPPTKAAVTLTSIVTGVIPQNTIIAGYDVTLTLPPGVTVKTSPTSTEEPRQIDPSIITGAPVDAFLYGTYSAATTSLPGTVHIVTVSLNANGFAVGDFATVNGDIAAGYTPSAADFSQSSYASFGFDTSVDNSVDLTSQVTVTASAALN